MSMSGVEVLCQLLAQQGVTTLFGTVDLTHGTDLGYQRARGARGAALMASGYARASGQPGVVLVHADDETFDALAVLAEARTDGVPLLLISLQAGPKLLDLTPLSKPLTAAAYQVQRLTELPQRINEAWRAFGPKRAKPVHLVLPDTVLNDTLDTLPPTELPEPLPSVSERPIETAARWLRTTPLRPVMIIGLGAEGASEDLVAIAETTGALILSSTAGKGIVPDDHPQSLGAVLHRNELLTRIDKADVLLVAGTSRDPIAADIDRIPFSGEVIQIDCQAPATDRGGKSTITVTADTVDAIRQLREAIGPAGIADRQWVFYISKVIREDIDANLSASERQHAHLLHLIQRTAPEFTVWSTDASELAESAAMMLPTQMPRRFLYPEGLGVSGTAIPSALGAAYTKDDTPVGVITDNKGLFAAIQELPTLASTGRGLPIVVWENADAFDIDLVAEAAGCVVERPASSLALEGVISDAFAADSPVLVLLGGDVPWLG